MDDNLFTKHPLPWQVLYRRPFQSWHEQSQPYVADANKQEVIEPQQYVNHPGKFDKIAVDLCFTIVSAVNTFYDWDQND